MTPGFAKVRASGKVTEYLLRKNGLRILHKEDRAAPVALVMVLYHIGSRNEAVGHTGSTHILEHLLFKDSKHFNKKNGKNPTGYLEKLGAYTNATTWFDRTNYYELIAKEHLAEALAFEADRMRGALFSDLDLASEMTVVRNEYERSRNDPIELLDEAIWASAFQAHPYHHPTIGWKDDIERSSARKLREFYDRFYHPNNATLIVFGDISAADLLPQVARTFGKVPPSPHPIEEPHTRELPQEGRRFVEVVSEHDLSLVGIAHKVPEALHGDTPALQVFGKIVAGGVSSRLQERLVDTGRAVSLTLFDHPLRDPGLFILYAHLTPDTRHDEAAAIIRREYADLALKGPSAAEVSRAREQLLAEIAYARDGVYKEGQLVGSAVAVGDWSFAYRFPALVKKVTPRDVKRVARTYCTEQAETTGYVLKKTA